MGQKAVKLNESLVEQVIRDAKVSLRSTPMQIEYCYRLGRLAEQYPDLPVAMIKSLMISTEEEASLEFQLP